MSEFIEYLKEVFQEFGEIGARRMFGGYGIYHDELMFGLVADDVLYLKTDDESVQLFRDRNLTPFEFVKDGKPMKMSYYLAPEEVFDDPDVAKVWAELAHAAARRSGKGKKTRKGKA